MKPRVTMAEVARRLGVHPTTVSMALRGHHQIPSVTREKVQEMARQLGYRPNPLVSALMTERKKGRVQDKGATIAFLTAMPERNLWRDSSNYALLYEEITRHAHTRGYSVEEFWLREPGMTPARLRQILLYRGIRGLMICPLPNIQQALDFDFADFAAVALGLTLHDPALDRVAIDYFATTLLAVSRLIERGHRRIGFVRNDTVNARVNYQSVGAFLAARQINPRHFVAPVEHDRHDPANFLAWVRDRRPDAIITTVRQEYQIALTRLASAGYDIPADLSVICLDCLAQSEQSGIVQNLQQEAHAAVDWLTSRIERAQFGVPNQPQTLLVEGIWRDGESVLSRSSVPWRKIATTT